MRDIIGDLRDGIGATLIEWGARIMRRESLREILPATQNERVKIGSVFVNADVAGFERGMRRAKGGAL